MPTVSFAGSIDGQLADISALHPVDSLSQKKLRLSWLRDAQQICSDAYSNNAVPELTDIELCETPSGTPGSAAKCLIEHRAPEASAAHRSWKPLDRSNRDCDRFIISLLNNDEVEPGDDSIETRAGQWTSPDASASSHGYNIDVMTASNGRISAFNQATCS
jgi:hypothetical protein